MARGKKISHDARAIIGSAYKFFLEGRKEDAELAGRTREVVAKCLGTSESSVYRVVKQHKAKEDSNSVEIEPEESVYQHVQKEENKYLATLETEELADAEDEDSLNVHEGSESDNDIENSD